MLRHVWAPPRSETKWEEHPSSSFSLHFTLPLSPSSCYHSEREDWRGGEQKSVHVCVSPVVRAHLYFSCQSEPHGAAADIRYNSLVYIRRLVMGLETKRGWMWNAGTQLYYINELHRILGHGEGVGRMDRWMDGSKRGVVELTALF